jgi:hypothetical protein
MNWQPIESAPKDSTWVLLWQAGWQAPLTGFWCEDYYGVPKAPHWVFCNPWAFSRGQPTHWMPLPPPPTTETE